MEIKLDEQPASEAVKLSGPVAASLRFDKAGADVIVTGTVSADVELNCSRCLNDYKARIDSKVEVTYHPSSGITRDEHHQLKGDELETSYYSDDAIDTDEVLVEQLLLNVPMKPLCSNDCEGICPVCGADRNKNKCSCIVTETDPRLRQLEQLLKKKEQ
ncbi:MAG: DUF177 domain-containing protein [Nitrospiraceae bacterium]|nr:DUF177 domain-containing protein [Nitrospiraceae bacterium]